MALLWTLLVGPYPESVCCGVQTHVRIPPVGARGDLFGDYL